MQKTCFRPSRSPLPKLARQCYMLVSMAVPLHIDLIRKGTFKWNGWRNENDTVLPGLGDARLRYAHLGV